MQRAMMVGSKWWTDYPFTHLGDEPGEPAPIRRVVFMGRGGSFKYVWVRVGGATVSIKWGYLYRTRAALLRAR